MSLGFYNNKKCFMNEKRFTVLQYMKSEVITLPASVLVRDAIELMLKKKTNGIVIVDQQSKVCGILSSWDIIQFVVPDYLEEDRHLAAFEAGDVFVSRVKEVMHEPITKCMTKNVHTVIASDSLMKAATLLSEFKIRQLPVVDGNGVLVGYINRSDIKRAIGDILGLSDIS